MTAMRSSIAPVTRFLMAIAVGTLVACGADIADGTCSVDDTDDGRKTISCDDGTSVTVSDGADGMDGAKGDEGQPGANGASCTVDDTDDGRKTISCDDG